MTSSDYDIYIVAHVDELKRENAHLRKWVEELIRENGRLHTELDRHRRVVRDTDYCYLTD